MNVAGDTGEECIGKTLAYQTKEFIFSSTWLEESHCNDEICQIFILDSLQSVLCFMRFISIHPLPKCSKITF